MSAGFWFWFWLAVALALLNVLYGMWLLGRFGLTAETALEPREPHVASLGAAAAAKPAAKLDVVRHERFNQVRREAVSAALKDFGRLLRTPNPYQANSVAHAAWASHYERVMHDQFSLEVARLDAESMERA